MTISGPSLLCRIGDGGGEHLAARPTARSTPDPSEEDRRLWRATLVVSLLYLLLGSFWYQHWYMLWVLAPAALLPYSGFTRNVAPWLTLGSLSSNVVADYLPQLAGPPLARTGRVIAVVATTWLPAVLAAVILLARRRHVE